MRALSLKEPWLSMIVDGQKRIETRRWRTNYRGDPLLCGSKTPNGRYAGVAACIIEVTDCRPMTIYDWESACCQAYPGAWAWTFRNVRRVDPFPVSGKLSIYDVPSELVRIAGAPAVLESAPPDPRQLTIFR